MRLAVFGALLLAIGTARAHSFDPALLDLRETAPGTFDVTWKSPAPTAAATLGALAPRFPPSCRVAAADLVASDDTAGEPRRLRLDCRPAGLHGLTIGVDGLAGTRLDALVRIAWRDGAVTSGVCRAGEETFVVSGVASGAPAATILRRYLWLGVTRLAGGFDHLLFVAGLLLLVEGTGAVVRTLAAFALAHSVTLAAVVLGGVTPPLAPVDAAVALGIVLVATELARPTPAASLTQRVPWLPALIFGLLHGVGLAAGLRRSGVPSDQAPLALAAFNAGVELALLAFVFAMRVPVAAWRRTAPRSPWRLAPIYALGTIAVVWTIAGVLAIPS